MTGSRCWRRGGSLDSAAAAEGLLAAAEREAIDSAELTEGAVEFLEAMHQRGTPVAIVSNNGERAIRAYLDTRSLSGLVAVVSGRDAADARLMKPNPRSLVLALKQLEVAASSAAMIGDSPSDIVAARAIGVPVIAYANKERKRGPLRECHPDAVIDSMRNLTAPS